MSGYVIGLRYPVLTGRRAIREFAVRRVLRLYPLYALALTGYWLVWFPGRGIGWALIQYACLGVLVSGPNAGVPLVATLYFVQIILLCYVVYGIVVSQRSDRARLMAAALVALFVVVWCIVLRFGDERIVLYVPAFAFGAAAARWPVLRATAGRALVLSGVAFVAAAAVLVLWTGVLPLWALYSVRVALPIVAFGPAWWVADGMATVLAASLIAAASVRELRSLPVPAAVPEPARPRHGGARVLGERPAVRGRRHHRHLRGRLGDPVRVRRRAQVGRTHRGPERTAVSRSGRS